MKWKLPLHGDKRIVRKFAVVPQLAFIDNRLYRVWFEWFWEVQEYRPRMKSGDDWVTIQTTLDQPNKL
jgi:hypothetical protein